jgi:hypothetical protein
MLKGEVEVDGEYAWQERLCSRPDEYRKVTLLAFLSNPGGKQVLVRDKDGEFETQLQRLIKPWSELGPKEKESEFRTRTDEYDHGQRLAREQDPVGFEIEETWRRMRHFEPGKAGVPRVPEWLPGLLTDMASGVLKFDLGRPGPEEDEQIACHNMLYALAEVCERIRSVGREMLPLWEAEEDRRSGFTAENVRRRLDRGDLPFASSEIMPVYDSAMSRRRSTATYYTDSVVAADFMERVADQYEELDRYASFAVRWGWGFYFRWRRMHRGEARRADSRARRRR